MKRIRIDRVARADLDAIFNWIAADNPAAAERVLDRIDETIRGLADYSVGRPGRVEDTYEKLVIGLPYLIIYRRAETPGGGEEIVILTIHHTSRDYPR